MSGNTITVIDLFRVWWNEWTSKLMATCHNSRWANYKHKKEKKEKTVGLTGYNFLWVSRKIPVLVKLCDGTHWETEAQYSWSEIPMQLKPQNSPARTKSQKVACATNTTARFVRPKRGGELLFSVKNRQEPHTYHTKSFGTPGSVVAIENQSWKSNEEEEMSFQFWKE